MGLDFSKGCPDQFAGTNCTESWIDELAPTSFIVTKTLCFVNVVLSGLSGYFLVKNKLYSYVEYKRQKLRMRRKSFIDSNVGFKRTLLFFIFLGVALMELGHAFYFYFGMFLDPDYSIDTNIGVALAFVWTLSMSICFSVVFCVTTVIQITIVKPIQGSFMALTTVVSDPREKAILNLRLVQAEDMKGILMFLGPVSIGWFVIWILLFMDKFETNILFLRTFVGYNFWTLLLQGLLVRNTGKNTTAVVDTILAHSTLQPASREKYQKVKDRMQTYTYWMCAIFFQNSGMVLVIGATEVAHNMYLYFILVTVLGASLAGTGIMVLYVFYESPKKSTITKKATDDNDGRPNVPVAAN